MQTPHPGPPAWPPRPGPRPQAGNGGSSQQNLREDYATTVQGLASPGARGASALGLRGRAAASPAGRPQMGVASPAPRSELPGAGGWGLGDGLLAGAAPPVLRSPLGPALAPGAVRVWKGGRRGVSGQVQQQGRPIWLVLLEMQILPQPMTPGVPPGAPPRESPRQPRPSGRRQTLCTPRSTPRTSPTPCENAGRTPGSWLGEPRTHPSNRWTTSAKPSHRGGSPGPSSRRPETSGGLGGHPQLPRGCGGRQGQEQGTGRRRDG